MSDLSPIDRFFLRWVNENMAEIRSKAPVNRTVEDVIEFYGWPSRHYYEPYLEEIQHVLDTHSYDLGIPVPDEIIAYQASRWCGNDVPVDHILIRDKEKFLDIWKFYDYFDEASEEDYLYLWDTVKSVARGELADNMGDREDAVDYFRVPYDSATLRLMLIIGFIFLVLMVRFFVLLLT